MQDIKAIVQGIGVELTDEQMEALAKGVRDNYVTRPEMDEKRKRIESLTAENSELAEKAKALDGTSEDVAKLKAKVAEYEQAAEERDERDAEARSRKGFEERFEAAIGRDFGGRKFANAMTRRAVLDGAYERAAKNPDMSAADAIKAAIGDEGGVWANPQSDPAKMPIPGEEQSKRADMDSLADRLFGPQK